MREPITQEEANQIKEVITENGGRCGVSTICRKVKTV